MSHPTILSGLPSSFRVIGSFCPICLLRHEIFHVLLVPGTHKLSSKIKLAQLCEHIHSLTSKESGEGEEKAIEYQGNMQAVLIGDGILDNNGIICC